MQLFVPDDPRPIHFMGIAGAGMSALALLARSRGVAVTGCDANPRGAADVVRLGIPVLRGHDAKHVVGVRAVVHTSAVPSDHAELEAAKAAGIPVIRRAEALGCVVNTGTTAAIAGTHGKTTTTVMTTLALEAAGRDPTGIAGGRVPGWRGNARIGGTDLFVVEADEYDRSFLALKPRIAVVNNVEADHLECYGSLDALESAFVEFASRAERVLVGADDHGALRVARRLNVPMWLVGSAPGADIRLSRVEPDCDGTSAWLGLPGGRSVAVRLRVPGKHNVNNAAMALGVVRALDGDIDAAVRGLADFQGVERRFQVLGTAGAVTVVDDYAHHPTEVAAAIAAARQTFPGRRLIAVFQPHLYSRTQTHGEALGEQLAAADQVVVTAIYPAREQPVEGVTGRMVADAVQRAGTAVEWIADLSAVPGVLVEMTRAGDVVLTLGAGDITEVGPEFLRAVAGAAA